jgi:hypothetical protein
MIFPRVLVGAYHEALQQRRRHQQSQEFELRMDQRNAIEGTLSELVRSHGLRRARYKGFAKVDLQNQLIAAACNIKRWFQKLVRTAFGAQREDVALSGASLLSVLAYAFAEINPWSSSSDALASKRPNPCKFSVVCRCFAVTP